MNNSSDCISRQAVLELIADYDLSMGQVVKGIHDLPSVTPQEPKTFKWCTDCKEYDQEKHCCHRWSKNIRDTIEEMKQGYIEREVLDKIDEIITDALDKSTDQKESQTLRWVLDKISEVVKE